jgi:hypothetical protein
MAGFFGIMLWRGCGRSGRPETPGLRAVEPAIGIDRHAVVAPRLRRADQIVEHPLQSLPVAWAAHSTGDRAADTVAS